MISVDAMRYDMTSLAPGIDPSLTPNLRGLVERGAFSFERGYSASSSTLTSMSSVHTMATISSVRIEIGYKPWTGVLATEEQTLAEHFSLAGYETFWVGHNFNDCFDSRMVGLKQGFDTRRLVHSVGESGETDAEIANAAIEMLGRVEGRFFGWIFFVSPHSQYKSHYDDMPAGRESERYIQELRYADEQLGRVLEALERSGRMQNTIIVSWAITAKSSGSRGGIPLQDAL